MATTTPDEAVRRRLRERIVTYLFSTFGRAIRTCSDDELATMLAEAEAIASARLGWRES